MYEVIARLFYDRDRWEILTTEHEILDMGYYPCDDGSTWPDPHDENFDWTGWTQWLAEVTGRELVNAKIDGETGGGSITWTCYQSREDQLKDIRKLFHLNAHDAHGAMTFMNFDAWDTLPSTEYAYDLIDAWNMGIDSAPEVLDEALNDLAEEYGY